MRLIKSAFKALGGWPPDLRSEVDWLRHEAGQIRDDLAGAEAALRQTQQDLSGYRRAYDETCRDRDGYRKAYDEASRDRDGYHKAYDEACRDREGYHKAYDEVCKERDGYRRAYDETCFQLNRARQFLADSHRRRPCPPQFAFFHLAKAAGHAVRDYLADRFDPVRCLAVGTPADLDPLSPGELEHVDFVYGHFAWRNVAALRPDRFLCTFLRDPVDRVVSLYWYYRCEDGLIGEQMPAGELPEEVARARRMDLVSYVRDDHPAVRRRVRDHQVRAVAGDWDADAEGDGAAVLGRALENLRAFDFVGVTERLDEGVAALAGRMGWDPPRGPLNRVNVTPRRPRLADLTAAERAAVEDVTRVDREFYRAARERVDAELAAGRRRAA